MRRFIIDPVVFLCMAKRKKRAAKKPTTTLGKIWYFIWEDDSVWSWLANIALAFILIKFIVYPVLGFLLGTNYPIVAVVSGSMEHDGSFDEWWSQHEDYYTEVGISKEEFWTFPFRNGFNTGDIMVLYGKKVQDIEIGDVLVYWGSRSDPIIHRIVDVNEDGTFVTKGDHNADSNADERSIAHYRMVGYEEYNKGSVALFRIPFLGYLKIAFVSLVQFIANLW
jgi:hypothetical protein